MGKTKKFQEIINKFLCCVPTRVIKYIATQSSGSPSCPNPYNPASALTTWSGYTNFTVGVVYHLRLIIKTNMNCTSTIIFDSEAGSTDTNWQYYSYKLKDVILTYNGCQPDTCAKGHSICVFLGLRVDNCGNPIPSSA
jgi:hypothetical protein